MKESVSVDDDGQGNFVVKVATDLFEINLWIPHAEVPRLGDVHRRRWEEGAIAIGTSAGAKVFWCSSPSEGISLMIGLDDETWDVGLTLSASCLDEIISELHRVARDGGA